MTRKPYCPCGEQDPARYYKNTGWTTCKACANRKQAERNASNKAVPRAAIPLSRNDLIMQWIGVVK